MLLIAGGWVGYLALRHPGTVTKVARSAPEISNCGLLRPTAIPSSLILACGDGGIYMQPIRWSSWSASRAVGSGVLHENNCDPDCAGGHVNIYKANVTLSGVDRTTDGPEFTRVTVTLVGGTGKIEGSRTLRVDFGIYDRAVPAIGMTAVFPTDCQSLPPKNGFGSDVMRTNDSYSIIPTNLLGSVLEVATSVTINANNSFLVTFPFVPKVPYYIQDQQADRGPRL
jgi:hypothetical protein